MYSLNNVGTKCEPTQLIQSKLWICPKQKKVVQLLQ